MNEVLMEIKEKNIGKIVKNVSLKSYTSYKVGGRVKAIVFPKNTTKLIQLIRILRRENIKYMVLGNGSNILFSDKIYDGIIIKLDEFNQLKITGNTVKVGAGYSLMKLSSVAMRHSLSGLEFASGIPGSVGGAIYMNAGAYKSDMGYVVYNVKVLTKDLHVITMSNSELDFHYRTSFFQKNKDYICLEATLKLKKGVKEEMLEVVRDRKQRRMLSQPLEYPSAGSVFRNPGELLYAGKLIEDLGLKGLQQGGAKISDKHANFIINTGNAKAKDIKDLIEIVKTKVLEEYNIELKVEQEEINWE